MNATLGKVNSLGSGLFIVSIQWSLQVNKAEPNTLVVSTKVPVRVSDGADYHIQWDNGLCFQERTVRLRSHSYHLSLDGMTVAGV